MIDIIIDLILIGFFLCINITFIINFFNERTYVKAVVEESVGYGDSVYVNLYDYKRGEALPRFITDGSSLKELRLNKDFIIYVNFKKKIKFK